MSTRVLVVDSNHEFAILIRQSLEESGAYDVSLATSGEEALSVASDQDFDLAIVDLDLPDFQGTEIIRRLRSIQPEIKVVAIPMGGREQLPGDESLGVEGVLTKPFYLPDLPRILREALAGPKIQPQRAAPTTAADQQDTPVQESKSGRSIPTHLQDADQATAMLSAGLEASQAEFGLLLHQDHPLAHAGGLSHAQLRELSAAVPELDSQGKRGAVTRYFRLPDRTSDDLLYAAPIAARLGLALIFPADVAFRTAREQTQRVASNLLRGEEEATTGTNTSDEPEDEPQQAPPVLPTDWLPETELSPAQQSMLEEWADLETPQTDPAEEPREDPPPPQTREREALPSDWVPRERPPESRLSFAEEHLAAPAPQENDPVDRDLPGDKMQEAAYHLPFTAVLIPRFPEHQLTGALARQVREWTRRLCVAWDWRAEEIHVEPDALRLRVSLIPESAPAKAVERLREDLSRRILDRYPQFKEDLPSDRFWARGYLLTAGDPPGPDRIERFITHTRRAQGFEV